jgi:beta-galactosidase
MRHKNIIILALVIFSCLSIANLSAQFYPVRNPLLVESLNGTWKIKIFEGLNIPSELADWTQADFDVSEWNDIAVPGNWETQGLKNPEYALDVKEYTGLYCRAFRYNPAWDGRHVILRFDGAQFSYEVFVNGQKAGEWGSSFNTYQMDITPFLFKNQDNTLAVKLSTRSLASQEPNAWQFDVNDCWALAGITRDVEIFTLEDIYLQDVRFVSEITENSDANIKADVNVDYFTQPDNAEYTLRVSLSDLLRNHVLDFSEKINPKQNIYHFEKLLENPKLWTAETPNLYHLEVCIVNKKGVVIQRNTENIGIRSVRVDGYDLKVNNVPVLLRGACLNEIDPKLGRAMPYKERRRQLEMMKAANINYIRTAHYPFAPDFYDLCDEMGFYVINEVPFGFGDKNLSKDKYLPELLRRAEATISRDKNHPSVIIWSIGNENPYTPVVEEVIKYVKEKDPTRLRGLPQVGSYFLKMQGKQSSNVDIYMPHYIGVTELNRAIEKTDKPLILTEYAHSLGLAMDEFAEQIENIVKQPRIIGGSVWCWTDQSVLVIKHLDEKETLIQGVWLDTLHFLDNSGNKGADGIVYADGYPQEDFFLVRKLYSPVQILTDTLQDGRFEIELENRFDFLTLNGFSVNWKLRNLHKIIDKGSVFLNTPTKRKDKISIQTKIPENLDSGDLMLCVEIINPEGKSINEKNIIVVRHSDSKAVITGLIRNPLIKATVSKSGILTVTENRSILLETPLLMRVGRKMTITAEAQASKEKFLWQPYILEPKIGKIQKKTTKDGLLFTLDCVWTCDSVRSVSGVVNVLIAKSGAVQFDYSIKPAETADGNLLECGLTLKMQPDFDTFRWLGNGPFSSAIGKTAFNERDIWALQRNDIRFNGNRANVDLAVVTNPGNYGIGLQGKNGNIGVENIDNVIYVSQNAIISGYGSKFKAPKGRMSMENIGEISGSLTVFFDTPKQPVEFVRSVLGNYKPVNPENPYMKSYGW